MPDEVISDFSSRDDTLLQAVEEASINHQNLMAEFGKEVMMQSEVDVITSVQSDIINFYAPATVNPYIAIAGRGPWIVTAHGAVLHDNGGYGMLGVGHGPESIIDAMSKNWVMANVMTPSFSQKRLTDRLKKEMLRKSL